MIEGYKAFDRRGSGREYFRQVCIHEAGHAVAATICGLRVERVTVEGPWRGGKARYWCEPDQMQHRTFTLLAAPAAELLLTGRFVGWDAGEQWGDIDTVREIEGPDYDVGAGITAAVERLRPYRQGIKRLADMLRVRREVSGDDVRRFVRTK
jgi:hypothetical protein